MLKRANGLRAKTYGNATPNPAVFSTEFGNKKRKPIEYTEHADSVDVEKVKESMTCAEVLGTSKCPVCV